MYSVHYLKIANEIVLLLQWLENDFLSYLCDWEKSVKERSGFTKTAMNSMLLSRETILGLKMTSK